MERQVPEVLGIRRTGWAVLGHPRAGGSTFIKFGSFLILLGGGREEGAARAVGVSLYGMDLMQYLQGKQLQCHYCRKSLRVSPVVLLHDQEEKLAIEAMVAEETERGSKSAIILKQKIHSE